MGAEKGESPSRAPISASSGCHRQIPRMATIHGRLYRKGSPPVTKVDCETTREIADELAQADADYAAGNTISGEDVRQRYGLE